MLSGIGLFKGIMTKMNWLDQNQRVIAQNVANADTPGYSAKKLKTINFADALGASLTARKSVGSKPVALAATDGQHFGAGGATGAKPRSVKQDIEYEASPDNNGVVIEEQMLAANKNAAEYQIATNVYRRNMGMLRMALQGSRG